MKAQGNVINQKTHNKWFGAGLLAAITASLCCITPVLALLSGASGIAATFSWMEPVRPFLIGLTVLILGFAWYQKLKVRETEEIDCACKEDGKESFLQSKTFLGIVTVLAIILLSFPGYSHIFYPDSIKSSSSVTETSIHQLKLDIRGMTCAGCEEHVKYTVNQLEGLLQAEASFETGTASISYDQSVVSKDEIVAVVNQTGYEVTKVEVVRAE